MAAGLQQPATVAAAVRRTQRQQQQVMVSSWFPAVSGLPAGAQQHRGLAGGLPRGRGVLLCPRVLRGCGPRSAAAGSGLGRHLFMC